MSVRTCEFDSRPGHQKPKLFDFSFLVQYSKDSPNAFFRKIPPANPPAGGRKGGEAAPIKTAKEPVKNIGSNHILNFGGKKIFMNIKKVLIIAAIVLGLIVIGVLAFVLQKNDSEFNNNQYIQNTTTNNTLNYYDNLANECKNKESESCCLASVEAMKQGNYTLAPQEGCPAGFQPNMMRCIDSYRWCQQAKDSTTTQPQTESKWKVFQDSRYTFQFEYPSDWGVGNQEGTSRVLILKDKVGAEIITIDTGVNLSIIGISYCGAYPQDSRCESLKTENGNFVTIDWDVSEKANAMFGSQDGTYGVSFTLHKVNSDTKDIFKKILSTFKFVK